MNELTTRETLEGLLDAFYGHRDIYIGFGWEDMARGVETCIGHMEDYINYCLSESGINTEQIEMQELRDHK